MPDPNWRPEGAPPQGNRFFQKLGVYLLGVAIGLVFLGWVQYRKGLARQAQQTQSQQTPAGTATTPDPSP
jgi:Na+/melibiose symporter-like transporter